MSSPSYILTFNITSTDNCKMLKFVLGTDVSAIAGVQTVCVLMFRSAEKFGIFVSVLLSYNLGEAGLNCQFRQ